jgi:hypothetical protein
MRSREVFAFVDATISGKIVKELGSELKESGS